MGPVCAKALSSRTFLTRNSSRRFFLQILLSLGFFALVQWLPVHGTAGGGSGSVQLSQDTRLEPTGKATLFSLGHSFVGGPSLVIGSPFPHYSVDVLADGSVIFTGYGNVRTEDGKHLLSKSECDELLGVMRTFIRSGVKSASGSEWGYASIDYFVDGFRGRFDFDRTNFEEYRSLRNQLEKYLRTKSYRCPVKDPIRTWRDQKFDICDKLIDFEALI